VSQWRIGLVFGHDRERMTAEVGPITAEDLQREITEIDAGERPKAFRAGHPSSPSREAPWCTPLVWRKRRTAELVLEQPMGDDVATGRTTLARRHDTQAHHRPERGRFVGAPRHLAQEHDATVVLTCERGEAALPCIPARHPCSQIHHHEAERPGSQEELGRACQVARLRRHVDHDQGVEVDPRVGEVRRIEAAVSRLHPDDGLVQALSTDHQRHRRRRSARRTPAGQLREATRNYPLIQSFRPSICLSVYLVAGPGFEGGKRDYSSHDKPSVLNECPVSSVSRGITFETLMTTSSSAMDGALVCRLTSPGDPSASGA